MSRKKKYIGYWREYYTCPEPPREFSNFREACRETWGRLKEEINLHSWGKYWIEDEAGQIMKEVHAWKSIGGGICFYR